MAWPEELEPLALELTLNYDRLDQITQNQFPYGTLAPATQYRDVRPKRQCDSV